MLYASRGTTEQAQSSTESARNWAGFHMRIQAEDDRPGGACRSGTEQARKGADLKG